MRKNSFEILTATMMGMTYEEVENAVKENAVVLFPVGVVEAHGPHLPLGADIFASLNQAIEIKRCFDDAGRSCLIAPPFYFGGTFVKTSALKAKKDKTEKEQMMADMISKSYDISDRKYIEPIVAWAKGE